jgi:diguanylate cyclase (GGDEF)-like protein/PAS domain S-box-containing protein
LSVALVRSWSAPSEARRVRRRRELSRARARDLRHTNRALRAEGERLSAIVAAQQTIASATTVEDCLAAVCGEAMRLVRGGQGAVVELPEGDDLVYHGSAGSLAPFRGVRIRAAGSLSGRCLAEGQAMVADDAPHDERCDREACGRMGIVSMAVLPLLDVSGPVGVLKVVSDRRGVFDATGLAALEVVAALASSQLARVLALDALAQINDLRGRTNEKLHRANRALAVAEERARRLAELSPDAVSIVGSDGELVYANPAAIALLGGEGLDASQGEGPAEDPGVDRGPQTRRWQAVLEHGKVVRCAVEEMARPDGTSFPVEISSAPYPLEDGVGVLSVFRDISERWSAEIALAESERRWRSAFQAAPVGAAEVGADGSLIEVNAAFCALVGRSREELRGAPLDRLVHPEELHTPLIGRLRDAAAGGAPLQVEWRLWHKDGQMVWVNLSATLIVGAEDDRRLLCYLLDITDRKRVESELQHLADHDSLTGLRNRRSLDLALRDQAARVARYGPQGAVLVLDLDNFKTVNDTLGHAAGDELIVAMAALLRRHLRETDVIARLGGDEFAVVLPFLDRHGAGVVASKIVDAVRSELELPGGVRCAVTASVGIAFFEDPERSGDGVLLDADLSMYRAKRAGRDRFVLAESESVGPRPALGP